MEKVLTIDGKKVPFKCTGGFLIRYKELTGRDPLRDIGRLVGPDSQNVDLSHFDTEVLFDIVWVMARTADPEVPDRLSWLDSFESFPILDVVQGLFDLLVKAFSSSMTIQNSPKKKMKSR